MPVIKRYPNRKLYDTEARQYVTLDGIAALIRQGQEVRVVDNLTGEDLTTLTLTQIILEQERKRNGFLPQNVLTGLIRSGGDTLTNLKRSLASQLDLARQVDDEIDRRLKALARRGELAAEEALRVREQLLARSHRGQGFAGATEAEIESALAERDLPTREQLQRVLDQLDQLTARLEAIEELRGTRETEGSE